MSKRIVWFTLLTFFSIGIIHPLAAQENLVFGPKVFERTQRNYLGEKTSFSASGLDSELVMRIHNGGDHGRHRISSGVVTLNKKVIASPADFRKSVEWIERKVTVKEMNTLFVKLHSFPGSFITISIVKKQLGPHVELSAEPETIPVGGVSLLSWNSSNAESATIDNGIGDVPVNGSLSVSPRKTTTYTITVNGSDRFSRSDNGPRHQGGRIGWAPGITCYGERHPDRGFHKRPKNGLCRYTATDSVTVTVTEQAEPTASISASPDVIQIGESAVLTWDVTNAETCVIDPDVGNGAVSGMVTITPTATTTYMVTATGPGGTAMADVTITVVHPPPTISISAVPETIQPGETTALTWNSTHVTSAVIDRGIGEVAANGSLSVSPTETTTYTITTTGPGGVATADVTVTVTTPPPTVSISAEPQSVQPGESAILTWTSTGAASVMIDQGIGQVVPDGTLAVSPDTTTVYTITGTGPGGTATASATVSVSDINISITSPKEGDIVKEPLIIVQGSIQNPSGNNSIGISVNGVLALIDGDRFVASRIALIPGENTITATAANRAGITAVDAITLNAEIGDVYMFIDADDKSGVAPFETTLEVDGSFNITDPVITYDGPGTVEISNDTEENKFIVRIPAAGLYSFTAEDTFQGTLYTSTIVLHVMDPSELDAAVRAAWEGMRSALIAGDVEKALTYHLPYLRPRYEAIYNALSANLPGYAQQMTDISMITYYGGIAKYRIRQDHIIEGKPVTITYYIYFRRDDDGLWKIDKY